MFGLFPKKIKIPQIAEIRLYFGIIRAGKSYCATDDVLHSLRTNDGIRVFTNWPVYDAVSKKYTYKIEREELTLIDQDADVYIDEAHFWYNSRLSLKKQGMTENEMSWYRTVGHRNIRVTLITHHPDRLDVIIRNIVCMFYEVKAVRIPFTKIPILFNITSYLSEADMTGLVKNPANVQTRWFSKKVANAYDTHHFKNMFDNDHVSRTWNPEEDKDIENNESENVKDS
jgi:hypothetical protein